LRRVLRKRQTVTIRHGAGARARFDACLGRGFRARCCSASGLGSSFPFLSPPFSHRLAICVRAAALMVRCLRPAVTAGFAVDGDLVLRAAHRAFIAWDSRFLPAGDIPLARPGGRPLRRDPFVEEMPTPSSRALIALPILSRSSLSSETLCRMSNRILLWVR